MKWLPLLLLVLTGCLKEKPKHPLHQGVYILSDGVMVYRNKQDRWMWYSENNYLQSQPNGPLPFGVTIGTDNWSEGRAPSVQELANAKLDFKEIEE